MEDDDDDVEVDVFEEEDDMCFNGTYMRNIKGRGGCWRANLCSSDCCWH